MSSVSTLTLTPGELVTIRSGLWARRETIEADIESRLEVDWSTDAQEAELREVERIEAALVEASNGRETLVIVVTPLTGVVGSDH